MVSASVHSRRIHAWRLAVCCFSTTQAADEVGRNQIRLAAEPEVFVVRLVAIIWMSVGLMLGCVLSFPSTSLADGGTWTKKADMATARCAFGIGAVGGKICAIGGRGKANEADGGWFTSIVEEYDPATDTCTRKANMPTPRGWLSASPVNGRIYAIGGATKGWDALPTVEEYNPAIDKWQKKADMPTARYFSSTSAVNGKIYAIGGGTEVPIEDSVISTVEEYDPGPRNVEAREKLTTTWGEVKVTH